MDFTYTYIDETSISIIISILLLIGLSIHLVKKTKASLEEHINAYEELNSFI